MDVSEAETGVLLMPLSRSNHSGEHVVDITAGPGRHITASQGTLLFTEEASMVGLFFRSTFPRTLTPSFRSAARLLRSTTFQKTK